MALIFEINGINTNLELYDNKVVIKPRGILGLGRSERTIPFSSISSIDFKKAGLMNGYVRFCESGHSTPNINIWNATKNANTFVYASHRKNIIVQRINDYVEMRLGNEAIYSGPPPENVSAELKILESYNQSTGINVSSDLIVRRSMIFIGYGLSAFSFVLAIAGAGKIIALAFLGWFLIFLPPIWFKTIRYGLLANIVTRAGAFILFPVFFSLPATSDDYQPSKVAKGKITDIKPTPLPLSSAKSLAVSPQTSSTMVNPSPANKKIVDSEKKMADYYNSLPAKMSIDGKVITLHCYEPSSLYFEYEGTIYAVNGTALGMGNPNPSRQYKERSDDIGIIDVTDISKKARLLCGR